MDPEQHKIPHEFNNRHSGNFSRIASFYSRAVLAIKKLSFKDKLLLVAALLTFVITSSIGAWALMQNNNETLVYDPFDRFSTMQFDVDGNPIIEPESEEADEDEGTDTNPDGTEDTTNVSSNSNNPATPSNPSSNAPCSGGATRLYDTKWDCDVNHTTVVVPSAKRILYVDKTNPNASNSNSGTDINHPLKTIKYAAGIAVAGDHVQLRAGGTYNNGQVEINNSGTASNPIVIEAYPGEEWWNDPNTAVITGDGILADNQSHLVIRYLNIANTDDAGIEVEGPGSNITIIGNKTHKTCSSGVKVKGVSWGDDPGSYNNMSNVIIESNLLEYGTFGCSSEVISVAHGVSNASVRFNTIRYSDADGKGDEGIDFKEGVKDSEIYGNLCYDLGDKCIYIDGGSADWSGSPSPSHDPYVKNIDIYNNVMRDYPYHGISITTEGKGDVDNIDVFNNIAHDIGGNAVLVFLTSGGEDDGGTVKNVRIVNNTAYKVGQGGLDGYKISDSTEGSTGMVIRNNIAWDVGDEGLKVGYPEITVDNNLCAEVSLCEINSNPKFTNPASHIFTLQSGSPAINSGVSSLAPSFDFSYSSRPRGSAVDLGAYEIK